MKHRAANRISGIKKGIDTIGEDKEIAEEEIRYFSSILSKDLNLDEEDQKAILKTIPSVINVTHNKALVAIPNVEEIKEIVLPLPAEKAPGLDGFPTFFF